MYNIMIGLWVIGIKKNPYLPSKRSFTLMWVVNSYVYLMTIHSCIVGFTQALTEFCSFDVEPWGHRINEPVFMGNNTYFSVDILNVLIYWVFLKF